MAPSSPRFDLLPLINALNLCLPAPNMFTIGRQECAGEFLDALFENINLTSHISSFQEIAICPDCNVPQTAALPTTRSPLMLLLPLNDSSHAPAVLAPLIRREMSQPTLPLNSTACPTSGCPNFMFPLQGAIQCREKPLLIYWLGRNLTNGQVKCLQQVTEPGQDTLWGNRSCGVVLAHCGRRAYHGHWVCFVKQRGVWWRSDTSLPGPRQENPFLTQLVATNPPRADDFTIDVLFFN